MPRATHTNEVEYLAGFLVGICIYFAHRETRKQLRTNRSYAAGQMIDVRGGAGCLLLLQEGADDSWCSIGGHRCGVGRGGIGGYRSSIGWSTVHGGSVGRCSCSIGRIGGRHSGRGVGGHWSSSRVGGHWSSSRVGGHWSSSCSIGGGICGSKGGSGGIGGDGSSQVTGLSHGQAKRKADEELQNKRKCEVQIFRIRQAASHSLSY